MKTIIYQMLSDVSGNGSSKRGIAFIILALFVFMAVGSCFGLTIKPDIWDDVFYGLLVFGGMITSEQFSKRSVRNYKDNEPK
ncbi:MAG: hypothetical protein Q8861_01895 [Bacteroidota bacterium]|nr:hypothetical protein [Bacteroidota bacterium]